MVTVQCGLRRQPQLTCGHVEGPGVDQQSAVHGLGVDLGQLGKPDVVADAEPNLTPRGREGGKLGARTQRVRLLEGHLPGDIFQARRHHIITLLPSRAAAKCINITDVEQVDLPMCGQQLTLGAPHS